ncbi:MAG: PilZ domain-containing protein [Pirellulales bacterium]
MFAELEDDLFKISDSLEAFNELEKCTDKSILALRSSERLDIRTKLVIRAGNPSERHRAGVEAVTADISNGGCMTLSSRAVLPGDIFWLTFSEDAVRIGSLLARCMRCRMVQEDAYEIGFRFLQNISLKDLLR